MFMLAVICLSLADAQSTVDETRSCDDGPDTLEEIVNAIKVMASVQQENAREMRDMKEVLRDMKRLLGLESGETNQTRLDEIANMVTSLGQVIEEVKDLKKLAVNSNETRLQIKNEFEHVRRLLNQTDRECVTSKPATEQTTTASPPDHGTTVQPSRQARVAALRCEYLTPVSYTHLTLPTNREV